jgi:hypothetical protein
VATEAPFPEVWRQQHRMGTHVATPHRVVLMSPHLAKRCSGAAALRVQWCGFTEKSKLNPMVPCADNVMVPRASAYAPVPPVIASVLGPLS